MLQPLGLPVVNYAAIEDTTTQERRSEGGRRACAGVGPFLTPASDGRRAVLAVCRGLIIRVDVSRNRKKSWMLASSPVATRICWGSVALSPGSKRFDGTRRARGRRGAAPRATCGGGNVAARRRGRRASAAGPAPSEFN